METLDIEAPASTKTTTGHTTSAPVLSKQVQDWQKMPLEQFLAGNYLERSDIVVMGSKAVSGRIIRWGTDSLFNHAALMFLVPNRDLGFEHSFIIESSTSGVDVTNFTEYARSHQHKKHMVILRLEQPWFDKTVQKRVRGKLLNYIKSEYDFLSIYSIIRTCARRILFNIQAGFNDYASFIQKKVREEQQVPNTFICSGLVQHGFIDAVNNFVDQGKLPEIAKKQVLFRDDLIIDGDPQEYLTITPKHLAESKRLSWKYVFKQGYVYKVSSEQEGRELLRDLEL